MNSLQDIIRALAPVFAAGFAVQQLLEILTSFFDIDSNHPFQKYKKPVLGSVAFLLGCGLARELNLGVINILKGLGPTADVGWTDFLATALIISADSEGVNSILKFLKYTKEEKKREAAGQDPQSGQAPAPAGVALPAVAVPATTEAALVRINQQ